MSKINAVIQMDSKDCGISCMQYIFKYYDGYVTLEKLREETLTGIDGTSAYHIIMVFKKFGFDAFGVLERDICSSKVFYPCIAHVVFENGLEHFVVVNKVINDTIYLMDPSVGYKKMEKEKFNKIFTGHIILASPREKLIKMSKGISISEIFTKILKKENLLIIKIIITSILWTILLIISSYYLKLGSVFLEQDSNLLKYFVILFGIFLIIRVFALYIREYYQNHLNNLVDLHIYPEFLRHLFSLPLRVINNRSPGEIMSRINDLASIKNLFSEIFIVLVVDSIMLLSSMVILCIINKTLFLILFIFMFIYILFGLLTSKIIYKKVLMNINYQTEFNSEVLQDIEAFESIKNVNITKNILTKIEESLSKLLLSNYEFSASFNIINLIKEFVLDSSFFIINTYGFFCIKNGTLSIINLFTFNIIISYFVEPIKNIINIIPKWNFIKASFSKISEFINLEEEKLQAKSTLIKGEIIFSNVYYSYNKYTSIINNFNMKIKEGDHVLLDGPSGVGKSTICKLIYKEYESDSGNILINNINIKDLSITSVRDNILYISQNEKLFNGSIKDNILVERDISDETFYEICEMCHVNEIVQKKKMRYESLVEADSRNISGGEKERIILARGLLKSANIIMLDEALSEVDEELEKDIIKNIRNFFKDKTIIYISHKRGLNCFEKVINIGD